MSYVPTVYSALYVGSGGSPAKAAAALSITTAKMLTVAVPVCSPRGRVPHLYVKQASGTAKAFDIELLTSAVPWPVGEAAYNAAAAINQAPFRVIDKKSVLSGAALELRDPLGWVFNTADNANAANMGTYLYLSIIPANTVDTTTWEVALVSASVGA